MIPEEVKDRILNEDLVTIITDEGISLKRLGGNYTCCCPFHNEKTPSFVVSPSRNIATCFGGCNHTWNAVTFIMELKGMRCGEALEYLADRRGIQYERREMTAEEREQRFAKDQLIAVNQEALLYFRQCYEQSPGARQYVKDRGWSERPRDGKAGTDGDWAVVLSAFRTVEKSLDLPFTYADMLELCAKLCRNQNDMTKQSNELSGFWDTVESLVSGAKVFIEADYRIIHGGREVAISQSRMKVELNPERQYLLLNFKRVAVLYAKENRDSGGKTIPVDSLRYYLENSREFMGTAKSTRFRQVESMTGYMSSDPSRAKTKVTTAMMFDYDALKAAYDINLEVTSYDLPVDDLPVRAEEIEERQLWGK